MIPIEHFYYDRAISQLLRAVQNHIPGQFIFLIGPSGVGKTTIRRKVFREAFGKPDNWGRGRIPIIEVFAKLPQNAFFVARSLGQSFLDQLHVPNLDWFLLGDEVEKQNAESIREGLAHCALTWSKLRLTAKTERAVWDAVQRTLAARGCMYLSVDQATALLVNRRNTSPAQHITHLMNIAEESKVMFIMTGVPRVTRLWRVHSELERRSTKIWVPPYSDKRPGDEILFLRLLKSLSHRYKLARGDLLGKMCHDLLAATGGVFAVLTQLLDRAENLAADEGALQITRRHIESSYGSNADLSALWEDIAEFEEAMSPGDISTMSAIASARWIGK